MAHKSPEYNWTPDVIQHDSIGDFMMQSENDPSVYYVVDALAYNGEGSCTCEDFCIRTEPMRRRQIEPAHKNCKHIRKAKELMGHELAKKIAEMLRKGQLKPSTKKPFMVPLEPKKKRATKPKVVK